jgi:cytochrome c
MAVYVDDNRIRRRGHAWSHLLADSTEELHAFAARLGLERALFHQQPSRPWKDHYDLPEGRRQQAIRQGARAISRRQAAEMLRAKRRAYVEPPRA